MKCCYTCVHFNGGIGCIRYDLDIPGNARNYVCQSYSYVIPEDLLEIYHEDIISHDQVNYETCKECKEDNKDVQCSRCELVMIYREVLKKLGGFG